MADAAFVAGVLTKTRRTALRTLPPSKRAFVCRLDLRQPTRVSVAPARRCGCLLTSPPASTTASTRTVLLGADGKDVIKKSTVRKGR